MRKFLVAITAAFLSCQTSYAFGDPVEAGVAAWCGARRGGASIDEANKQLRRSMSAQYMMSTDFASAMVGILGNRQGMQSQIEYRISKECPESTSSFSIESIKIGSPVVSPPTQSPTSQSQQYTNPQWDSDMCSKYPEAGGSNCSKTVTEVKEAQSTIKSKVSSPSINAPIQARKAKRDAHLNCLKANDYAGCMKFQLQAQ